MKVVTTEQIRDLDRRAIEETGIPGAVLMENAGRAVFELLDREYGPLAGKRVAVFCGSGNNGGDGFVIARCLHLAGAKVSLFLTFQDASQLKPDAAAHWKALASVPYRPIEDLPQEHTGSSDWSGRFDLAVDALLGTGIKDAPRGIYARAIQAINALHCPVVAVDIPSGVDADTGATPGDAVLATHTVTFAYPKLGLLLFPGAENTGKLHISDIGFPWASLPSAAQCQLLGCSPAERSEGITCSSSLREPMGWEKLIRKRRPESNKGDYGHIAIVAGSRGMVGAPALVARAAQRAGAGLVTVLTAQSAQPILATKLDEQMTIPLPEANGSLSEAAWDKIASFAEKATLFCVGPGLTTEPETAALIHRMLAEIERPIVLDADGLNALAKKPEMARARSRDAGNPLIITPHPGEAARLLETSIAQVQNDRPAAARELARRFHAVAVLKGRYTLIASPEGFLCINTSGNPGMATGGMGDTLTGIVGAILAQDIAGAKHADSGAAMAEATTPPLYAAALAVHLHGLAGDIVAAEHGETGLTAGDVIEQLPAAFSRLMLNR